MPRLNRAASQSRTRAALLAAARSVLVETGIGAASVDLIAERAGYSKGAVYSNFASKESILLVLLEEQMTVEVNALSELLQQSLPLDDLLERVRALYASMHSDPGIAILAVEFQLLATRSPTVRRSYNALWSRHRAALSDLIVVAAGRLGLQLRTPPPDLVDALAALMRGLVLRDAIGRVKGAKSAQDVLIDFLRDELSYVVSNPAPRAAKT